jgi:WD40 repeat protein
VTAAATTVLPDGRTLVITASNDAVWVWDSTGGLPVGRPLTSRTFWVRAVSAAVMPDGRVAAVVGGDDHAVRVLDLAAGQPAGPAFTHSSGRVDAVTAVATPDGWAVAAIGSDDQQCGCWTWQPGSRYESRSGATPIR